MIRKDREITDRDAIISIMRRCHVCRLAFNDATTGFPYIIPMNFGLIEDDGELILSFHCAKRGYKLDLIARNPHVAFEMECDVELVYNPAHKHNTEIFKSVGGYGYAEVVNESEKKIVLLQSLVNRYHEHHLEVTPADAARCTIFKVSVTQLFGKEKKLSK